MQKTITVSTSFYRYQLDIEKKTLRIVDQGSFGHAAFRGFLGVKPIAMNRKRDARLNAFVETLIHCNWKPRSTFEVHPSDETAYTWEPDGTLKYHTADGVEIKVNNYPDRFLIIRSILKKL